MRWRTWAPRARGQGQAARAAVPLACRSTRGPRAHRVRRVHLDALRGPVLALLVRRRAADVDHRVGPRARGAAQQREAVPRGGLQAPVRVRVEELHGEARRGRARRHRPRDHRRAVQPFQARRPGLGEHAARLLVLVAGAGRAELGRKAGPQRARREVPAQQLEQGLEHLRRRGCPRPAASLLLGLLIYR